MLELKFHTVLVVGHLVGLALGAGAAFITDLYILRHAVMRRIEPKVVHTAEFLGSIVALGLVILWVTGLALMAEAFMTKPQFYTNEKFWAKFVIVTVLTINGVIVHTMVLPRLQAQMGRPLFDRMPARDVVLLCGCGATSGVSWALPILLGSAKEWSYVMSFGAVLTLYVAAVAGVAAVASVSAIKLLPRFAPSIDERSASVDVTPAWQDSLGRQVALLRAVHEIAALTGARLDRERHGRIVEPPRASARVPAAGRSPTADHPGRARGRIERASSVSPRRAVAR